MIYYNIAGKKLVMLPFICIHMLYYIMMGSTIRDMYQYACRPCMVYEVDFLIVIVSYSYCCVTSYFPT